jgi:hypothetical protein
LYRLARTVSGVSCTNGFDSPAGQRHLTGLVGLPFPLVKGQDSVHNGVIWWVVMNSPEQPVTYESARAWALDYAQSSESTEPIEDVRHADLEADHQAGGFAFVVPGHQLMIIGRDGSSSVILVGHEEAEWVGHIDAWLAGSRHRHRPLTLAELGPWQQAAVAAYLADVTVGGLRSEQTPTALDSAGVDYAEYLLIRLRFKGRDPLRAMASDDQLMRPPDLSRWPGAPYTHPCPLCGQPTPHWNRYPREVCDSCGQRAADTDGRFITAYNTTIFGGFEARYRTHDGSTGDFCAEVTESGYCWIDNHKCTIDEHRFGGIVIELFPSADDPNVQGRVVKGWVVVSRGWLRRW